LPKANAIYASILREASHKSRYRSHVSSVSFWPLKIARRLCRKRSSPRTNTNVSGKPATRMTSQDFIAILQEHINEVILGYSPQHCMTLRADYPDLK
jgi:hypothetical protein